MPDAETFTVRVIAVVAAVVATIAATAAWGSPLPPAGACTLFPADNAWNRRVDTLPVAAGSGAAVAAIGATKTMHADFSGAPDPRWSNDDLRTLGRVPGSAFEVVDTASLRP